MSLNIKADVMYVLFIWSRVVTALYNVASHPSSRPPRGIWTGTGDTAQNTGDKVNWDGVIRHKSSQGNMNWDGGHDKSKGIRYRDMVYNWNWCGGMIRGGQRLFLTRQGQSYLFLIECTAHWWQKTVAMFSVEEKKLPESFSIVFFSENEWLDDVKIERNLYNFKENKSASVHSCQAYDSN